MVGEPQGDRARARMCSRILRATASDRGLLLRQAVDRAQTADEPRIGTLIRAGVSLPPSGAPLQRASPARPPGSRRGALRGPSPPRLRHPPNPTFRPSARTRHSAVAPPRAHSPSGTPSSTALPPRDAHPGTTTSAHGPARASTPGRSRCARIHRTSAGSVMNTTIRTALPQREHPSTSTRNTKRVGSAQRHRRALSAGQSRAGSDDDVTTGADAARSTPHHRHHTRRRVAQAPA